MAHRYHPRFPKEVRKEFLGLAVDRLCVKQEHVWVGRWEDVLRASYTHVSACCKGKCNNSTYSITSEAMATDDLEAIDSWES